jgi:hypothetical protein
MNIDIDTISFITGIILFIYTILEIEFVIKDLKVTKIPKEKKPLTLIIAVMFIVIGISTHFMDKLSANFIKTTETFHSPMYKNLPLDNCLVQGYGCGWAVANKYCKDQQNFLYAIDGEIEHVGQRKVKTRTIGDDTVCENDSCAAFTYITCVK